MKKQFKWNPFSMFGETPSSYRFKTDIDDLEFASKEDLEAIKADPRLSKLHQSMLAGVNKKFQSYADEKKQLQKTIETLQSQIAELDANLQEWENWYLGNKERIESLYSQNQPESGGKKGKSEGDESMYEKKYNQLVETINQAGAQMERKIAHLGRMLALSMQLNDLYRKRPDIDADKLLSRALELGERDLNRVYEDVYKDEILNKQVEERLGPRLEEELQKRTTKVETGSGATPIKFDLPKETPKTWSDASEEFLKERAAEAAKP